MTVFLIKEMLEKAKTEQGATDDNAAMELYLSVTPGWFRWLVQKVPFLKIQGNYTYGKMENGNFVYTSTWTARDN